jgi:hypothetical protein
MGRFILDFLRAAFITLPLPFVRREGSVPVSENCIYSRAASTRAASQGDWIRPSTANSSPLVRGDRALLSRRALDEAGEVVSTQGRRCGARRDPLHRRPMNLDRFDVSYLRPIYCARRSIRLGCRRGVRPG